MFPLEIFPVGGLASSVVTTVWVGVLVVAFLNLRFGTTLSGLVVPGYLIPLFILKPASAVVILLEAIITYLITRFVAEKLLIRIGAGELFGRDRFFALILFSILVRIVSDYYLLPSISAQLSSVGFKYELTSQLHSFGLIIIALCANQFWNGGLKQGGTAMFLYLLFTYLIIVHILIPLTNFNISTLNYMYEDVASSVLASPKAYIILVSAAFIASRMNLLYGWDFNGILIPALLALQWYAPEKILFTFIEAYIVLIASTLLLKLSIFKNMNIEGSRQIIFFFTVSLIYKFCLSYLIIYLYPGNKITDFYGFGYLLSTLIAIKMYEKGIVIRFTKATVQTSFVAAVMANIFGYTLTLYSGSKILSENVVVSEQNLRSDESLRSFVEQQRIKIDLRANSESEQLGPRVLDSFRDAFEMIKQPVTDIDILLRNLRNLLQHVGYDVTLLNSRYLVFYEPVFTLGIGLYVIDIESESQLMISVPRAVEESRMGTIALPLFENLNAKYLALTTARHDRHIDGSDDVLLNSQSVFNLFHQVFYSSAILQIRRESSEVDSLKASKSNNKEEQQGTIFLKGAIPQGLSLNKLSDLIGDFAIHWENKSAQNRQRDLSRKGFSELYVNRANIVRMLTKIESSIVGSTSIESIEQDGSLLKLLLEESNYIAAKHSQHYITPTESEVLYFDEYILKPSLEILDEYGQSTYEEWIKQAKPILYQVNQSAQQLGYYVYVLKQHLSDERYLIIKETNTDYLTRRHWGTYVMRIKDASSYQLQVPSPLSEKHVIEAGFSLFSELKARALLLSGTDKFANTDESSHLTFERNKYSIFNLTNQSLIRHFQDEQPMVLQVRAGANLQESHVEVNQFELTDVINSGQINRKSLMEDLQNTSLFYEGVTILQGQLNDNAQNEFLHFVKNVDFAEIKIPFKLREGVKTTASDSYWSRVFRSIGIPVEVKELNKYIPTKAWRTIFQAKLSEIEQQFEYFKLTQDPATIFEYISKKSQYRFEAIIDKDSGKLFLVIFDNSHGDLLAVYNFYHISQLPVNNQHTLSDSRNIDGVLTDFILRGKWLLRAFND